MEHGTEVLTPCMIHGTEVLTPGMIHGTEVLTPGIIHGFRYDPWNMKLKSRISIHGTWNRSPYSMYDPWNKNSRYGPWNTKLWHGPWNRSLFHWVRQHIICTLFKNIWSGPWDITCFVFICVQLETKYQGCFIACSTTFDTRHTP